MQEVALILFKIFHVKFEHFQKHVFVSSVPSKTSFSEICFSHCLLANVLLLLATNCNFQLTVNLLLVLSTNVQLLPCFFLLFTLPTSNFSFQLAPCYIQLQQPNFSRYSACRVQMFFYIFSSSGFSSSVLVKI